MRKMDDTAWLQKIADFMRSLDKLEYTELKDLIQLSLLKVKNFTDANQVYLIEKHDLVKATVCFSSPDRPNTQTLDAGFFEKIRGDDPWFLHENGLVELDSLVAESESLVLLPFVSDSTAKCILLTWDRPLQFTEGFKEFVEVSYHLLKRMIKVSSIFYAAEEIRIHFDAILQTIPQSVVFIDDSGKTSWVNENASRMFQLPAGNIAPAVLAQAMQNFRSKADNHDEISKRAAELFQTGKRTTREWKWIFSDPDTVYNVYWTRLNSGNVKGVLWMFEDVTEKHKAEKEIENLNLQLQQNIADKDKINNQLEQFTYTVAHDLKSPLSGMISLVELLKEDQNLNSSGETRELLDILSDASIRSSEMVDALLISSKKAQSEREPVNTIEMINQLIRILFVIRPAEAFLDPALPTFKTDKVKLEHIFHNLISNSIKFNDKDVVRLEIGVNETPEWYEFYVKDNGKGIELKDHERIFGLFETAENPDVKESSTGVGLNIVKNYVEDQGGRIWVESQQGEGSTFYFEWRK